jgi:hypothetical protein
VHQTRCGVVDWSRFVVADDTASIVQFDRMAGMDSSLLVALEVSPVSDSTMIYKALSTRKVPPVTVNADELHRLTI